MTASNEDDVGHVDRALLIAALDTVSDVPHHISTPIATAASKTVQALRIVLVSPLFDADPASDGGHRTTALGTTQFGDVQRVLTYVYVQATKVAQEMGKILMEVDVLLRGENEPLQESVVAGAQVVYQIRGAEHKLPIPSGPRVVWLPPSKTSSSHAVSSPSSPSRIRTPTPILFPVTALGGTFDHLHAGHKILLSMAAWITETKLIVGMTDDSLLQKKANKDVIQPLQERMVCTRSFLELFKPGLEYDLVPLTDVAGPTGWDPYVQALVVSKETLGGAATIENIRREKGLSPLQTFVIDVISPSESNLDAEDADALRKTKMSSTFIREWIVEQRTKSKS